MTPLWKVYRLIGRLVSFKALQACRMSSFQKRKYSENEELISQN
jgi:hypothetical protein